MNKEKKEKKENNKQEHAALDKKKTCFFVTPIGKPNSSEFKKMTALLNNVINPIIESYGYEAVVAHKIQEIGSIGDQVFKSIKDASLVISDLTGLNPNVMYETAVAHSFGKPTIIIVENDGNTALPFDLASDRAIFYENSIEGTGNLKGDLESKVRHIEETSVYDNPVLRVMKQAATLERMGESDDIQSQMYRMLIELKERTYYADKIYQERQLEDLHNKKRVIIIVSSDNEIDEETVSIIYEICAESPYKIKNIRNFNANRVRIIIEADEVSKEVISKNMAIITRRIGKKLPDTEISFRIIN